MHEIAFHTQYTTSTPFNIIIIMQDPTDRRLDFTWLQAKIFSVSVHATEQDDEQFCGLILISIYIRKHRQQCHHFKDEGESSLWNEETLSETPCIWKHILKLCYNSLTKPDDYKTESRIIPTFNLENCMKMKKSAN